MGLLGLIELNDAELPALQRLVKEPGLLTRVLKILDAEDKAAALPAKPLLVKTVKKGYTDLINKDITYLEGNGNTASFYYYASDAADRMLKLISGKSLSTFADWAKEAGLFRCHQSFFVNLNHVVLDPLRHCFVLTVNGVQKEIPISRDFWKANKVYLLNLPALKKVQKPE